MSNKTNLMGLPEFIASHRDAILSEWVAFTRTCRPIADTMSLTALRDDASGMLDVIAADLNTAQSKPEQVEKSKGQSDANPDAVISATAAQLHGAARAQSGFDMEQMVAEYRALRASVIRLWTATAGEPTLKDIEDIARFNEAIDQALAESTSRYAKNVIQSKDMFVAMLGHDLRTPLSGMILAAEALLNAHDMPEVVLNLSGRIARSGLRMNALIGDLLDFTQSRLGEGIRIVRDDMDLGDMCREMIEEVAALHPQGGIRLETSGDLCGRWDEARLGRVVSNLINNAIQYGLPDTPIDVLTRGTPDEVELVVHNWGPVIPTDQLERVFDPMHRLEGNSPIASRGNLGLGLYIAQRIVTAHEGTIDVESSEEKGTTFTIRLPRGSKGAEALPAPPSKLL